jgi:Zn-finger nucleic acid-binding protein
MSLEIRQGVTVDRCDRCRGIWFDAHELDHWLTSQAVAAQVPEATIPRRGIGSRQCPRCDVAMETAGWTGLVLDRCRECCGLFVEAHELLQMETARSIPEGQSVETVIRDALVAAGWTLLSAKTIVFLILRFIR